MDTEFARAKFISDGTARAGAGLGSGAVSGWGDPLQMAAGSHGALGSVHEVELLVSMCIDTVKRRLSAFMDEIRLRLPAD